MLIAALIPLPAYSVPAPKAADVPDWMVRGFEAAIAEPTPVVAAAAIQLPLADQLAHKFPPGDRAEAVLYKLLPLLAASGGPK